MKSPGSYARVLVRVFVARRSWSGRFSKPTLLAVLTMERKFYTFLVFPGTHARSFKIQLPVYVIHLALAFSLFGIITFAAMMNSYARMLIKVSDYNNVRSEREALKTQYKSLQDEVTQTNRKLGSLETLAAEVALTYGFGQVRHPQFPHAFLSLATQSDATVQTSYDASLSAFRMMKDMASKPASVVASQGFLGSPSIDNSMMPAVWPVRGEITSGFGGRMDPFSGEGVTHTGIDISAPFGSPVEATADGIVLIAEPDAGYGREILIDHGNGFCTMYGHLSQIKVVVGQEVKRGQIIGAIGMTGKSTGPHLHYEVHVHNAPVDPTKYLHG
jgi:murein DD-endopeptidase MepM/ murein hydrolase activator NlpD